VMIACPLFVDITVIPSQMSAQGAVGPVVDANVVVSKLSNLWFNIAVSTGTTAN